MYLAMQKDYGKLHFLLVMALCRVKFIILCKITTYIFTGIWKIVKEMIYIFSKTDTYILTMLAHLCNFIFT